MIQEKSEFAVVPAHRNYHVPAPAPSSTLDTSDNDNAGIPSFGGRRQFSVTQGMAQSGVAAKDSAFEAPFPGWTYERCRGRNPERDQTGAEEGAAIDREYYLSALVDRSTSRIAFVASTEGGMDIEEVAHKTPDKIVTFSVDPTTGFMLHHARYVAHVFGFSRELTKQAEDMLPRLYHAFVAKDMSLLEINPLVVTKAGQLICLDAKIAFDDNALYRHADVMALRDLNEEDEKEIEASRYDLNYVALDGTIGCMVNGAGLAMATMDIIKLYGETPANFLDVGGSATKEKVAAAFKIITSDHNVKGILVNIFGGIMKCDVIAEGVVAAVKEVGLRVPLVVRLEGTNVELGKKIISESNLNVTSADDLDDAAQKIVAAVKRAAQASG